MLIGVHPYISLVPDQPHTTHDHTDVSTNTQQLLEKLAKRVEERDPITIDEHPDFDTLGEYNPEEPITGRVEAWYTRTSTGGTIIGASCFPGTYSVVTCPENQDPDELFGTEFTATPVGWYHAPSQIEDKQDLPDTPGTYLLLTPLHDESH